jgi:hypothetical protein
LGPRGGRGGSLPPPPRAGEGWGGGPRISNLLDTLLVPAYHFRLDRLLKRMARKN